MSPRLIAHVLKLGQSPLSVAASEIKRIAEAIAETSQLDDTGLGIAIQALAIIHIGQYLGGKLRLESEPLGFLYSRLQNLEIIIRIGRHERQRIGHPFGLEN